MTRDETVAIMAVLCAAYPRFYAMQPDEDIDAAISLWAEMFADDPPEIVAAAVKAFITTDEKGFPPVIGQIKGQIAKIVGGREKSELEAWAEVKKALSNSGYSSKEEFAKLDPVIQRIVGAPSQLKEWAAADMDVLDSVIASNFQRSYRASARQYRAFLTLPKPVLELIQATADKMDFNRGSEEIEPKALPISVEATINELKQAAPQNPFRQEKQLTPEEFEVRRAEILKGLELFGDAVVTSEKQVEV